MKTFHSEIRGEWQRRTRTIRSKCCGMVFYFLNWVEIQKIKSQKTRSQLPWVLISDDIYYLTQVTYLLHRQLQSEILRKRVVRKAFGKMWQSGRLSRIFLLISFSFTIIDIGDSPEWIFNSRKWKKDYIGTELGWYSYIK